MPVLRFVDPKMEKFLRPLFLRSAFAGLLLLPIADASSQSIPMGVQEDVIRLSDADASCEQLYAEATSLEQQIAAMPKAPDPMEAIRQMQQDMEKAQKAMMGGSKAKGIAGSLLSMVPGGGLAASALSMVGRPDPGAMSASMDKSIRAQQESLVITMRLANLQARREHLTTLFLDRQCKVSALDRGAVTAAEIQVDGKAKAVDQLREDSAKDGQSEVQPSK